MPTILPEWIAKFSPELEVNLKEKFLNTTSTKVDLFLEKLTAWSQLNREEVLLDLLHQLFGYISLCHIYDIPPQIDYSAYRIINPFSFIPKDMDSVTFLLNLEDITSKIPVLIISEIHTSMDIASSISEFVKRTSLDIIMGNISPKNPVSKQDIINKIFLENNYQKVFSSMNVGTLTSPLPI